jgi:hypothetical protein
MGNVRQLREEQRAAKGSRERSREKQREERG